MSKMAAVRAILKENPALTASEIVTALARQKIKISEGVASNYKSVIKAKLKRRKKRMAVAAAAEPIAVTGESGSHGLEPALVELLKAGKELGWGKVRSIVELMDA
jgi:hypothetical protein